jgi:hypothetical protein
MPYGYYQLVRFIAFAIFAYFAYEEYTKDKTSLAYIYGALSILFQPFIKVSLGRIMWNFVDVVVAVFLIVAVVKSRKVKY